MTTVLRVAVIGRQFGARVHAPAFTADGRCEIVSVSGRDDWRQVVASPSVDAVSVAVPPAAQSVIVCEAAARGKHVFCEKPAASSVAAARQMLDAVTQAGVVHGIDFLFPALPTWQRGRELLVAGAIGRLQHFAYTWYVETEATRLRAATWKRRPDEGGGVLGNFVSHVFHNLEWLVGPLTRLERFWFPEGAQAGDAVDGTLSVGDASGRVSVRTDAFLGSGHVIELFGDRGTLVLANRDADYVNGFRLSVGTRTSGALEPIDCGGAAPSGDGRIAAAAVLARRFVDAVVAGTAMTPNLRHGLRVQQLLSLAAGASGAAQAVPAAIEELV